MLRTMKVRVMGTCTKPVHAFGVEKRRKRKQQERKGRYHRVEEKAWDLVSRLIPSP